MKVQQLWAAVSEQLQAQQRTRAHQVDPSLLLFLRPCCILVQSSFTERWQRRNAQKRWRIFSASSDGLSSVFLMKQKEAFNPQDQLSWQWNTVKSGWNPALYTRKGWKSSFLSKRGDKINGEGEYQHCLITAGISLLWERGLHGVNS